MATHRSLTARTGPSVLMALLVFAAATVALTISTPTPSAAALPVGPIETRIANHLGTTGSAVNNCIRYRPLGTIAQSTAWVDSTDTAWAGHGRQGVCPTQLDLDTQSSVGFTPTAVTSVEPSTPFPVAKVEHRNWVILSSAAQRYTGLLGVRMAGLELYFDWTLWETPNSTPCDPGVPGEGAGNCMDEITFANRSSNDLAFIEGVLYRLVVTGFSASEPGETVCPAEPGELNDIFWTDENAVTAACLYASLEPVRRMQVQVRTTGTGDVPTRDFTFDATGTQPESPWTAEDVVVDGVAPGAPRFVLEEELVVDDDPTITQQDLADDRWELTDLSCTQIGADGVTVEPLPSGWSANLETGELSVGSLPPPPNTDAPDITCTYTNTYTPLSTLTLVKQLADPTLGEAAPEDFELTAAGPTTITGPSGSDEITAVRVPAGTYELSELGTGAAEAGYVQVGPWTCTAGGTVTGASVVLDDRASTEDPVVCTVTNRLAAGSLQVVKAPIEGPDGAFTGTDDTEFAFDYDCGPDGSGSGSVSVATPHVIAGLPAGANCTVTEQPPTGNLADASFHWADPSYSASSVVIVDGETARITITNRILQDTGSLTIAKAPVGDGYLGGSAPNFTIEYTCGTIASFVTVPSGGSATVEGLPAGVTCELEEVAPDGALLAETHEWGDPIWSPDASPTVVANETVLRTVTNPTVALVGTISVAKAVSGETDALLPGASFAVDLDCSDGWSSPTGTTIAIDQPYVTPNLPVGTECTITESAPTGGLADGFEWGATPPAQQVRIDEADQVVAVTFTNPILAVDTTTTTSEPVTPTTDPTTTTSEPVTPTTDPTTTTSEPVTPTTDPTTTTGPSTSVPSTDTTAPPSTDTTAPPTSEETTTTEDPTVSGRTDTQGDAAGTGGTVGDGELPRTGSGTTVALSWALAALVLGIGFVFASRHLHARRIHDAS